MNKMFELIQIHPFEDKRGSLKKIAMKSKLGINIEEVYILCTNRGSIRGNHYHKSTVEYFTVVSGTARIALKDISTGYYEELTISSEDNIVLKVPANTAHAFKNEQDEPLIIIAVSPMEYDENNTDTFLMNILD